MRRFHALRPDRTAWQLEAVEGGGASVSGDFSRGVPFTARGPLTCALRGRGRRTSLSFDDFSTPIVSAEVAQAIERIPGISIQRLPVTIAGVAGRYEVLNVLRRVRCIDWSRTGAGKKLVRSGKLPVLDSSAIGPQDRLFWLEESRGWLIADDGVVDALGAAGAHGFEAVALEGGETRAFAVPSDAEFVGEPTVHERFFDALGLQLTAKKPLREGLEEVVMAASLLVPGPVWNRAARVAHGMRATDLVPWLESVVREEAPGPEIVSLWFGLFEEQSKDDESTPRLYIAGSTRPASPDDIEWADDPEWWPEGRYSPATFLRVLAEAARGDDEASEFATWGLPLAAAALAVREATAGLDALLRVGATKRDIVVGWDSGDFLLLPR